MEHNSRFTVNQPSVIGEVIDNEAIIVNLDSGAYYSLRGPGAYIWQMIERGDTAAAMVEQASRLYPAAEKVTIEAGVSALITELQHEQLIVPVADSPRLDNASPIAPPVPDGPFEAPVLEKYTDMADLLLLDPIHEVDDLAGWPHPPATNQ